MKVTNEDFDKVNAGFVEAMKELRPKKKVFQAMCAQIQGLRNQIVFSEDAEESKQSVN